MSGQLQGKTAIVTGAAQGLGEAIARAFCEAGARVMLTDVAPAVEVTAQELRNAGYEAEAMVHDVRERAQWDAVVSKIVAKWGRLDCLVNNAGITCPATIDEARTEDFELLLAVNLLGPFKGMQAAIPALRAAGGGAIVNIASNATRKMLDVSSIYAATKAGLTALSQCSAVRLAGGEAPIRVNTIHPGPHRTEMLLGKDRGDIPAVQQLVSTIPAGRIGEPHEIGAAAVFLASDNAAYINGAELFVDGGLAVT